MAVTVILPNALRPYAAGNDRIPLEVATVGEALQKLLESYPGGKDVRHLEGLDTELRPDDRITIIVPQGDL